jgi:hypothetical protein
MYFGYFEMLPIILLSLTFLPSPFWLEGATSHLVEMVIEKKNSPLTLTFGGLDMLWSKCLKVIDS